MASLGLVVVTALICLCHPVTPSSSSWLDAGADAAGLYCDFEDQPCRWQWSRFIRRSAAEINATIYSAADPAMISGPLDDAEGKPTGKQIHR